MQDFVDLLRESLVRTQRREDGGGGRGGGGFGDLVGKIGSSIRKSRIGLFSKSPVRALPPAASKDDAQPIRWRKGELIGSGAFGRVYMGMNLDSGELIAVKQVCLLLNFAIGFGVLIFLVLILCLLQVLIAANSASKEKTQA